jgi:hypothetical protein
MKTLTNETPNTTAVASEPDEVFYAASFIQRRPLIAAATDED